MKGTMMEATAGMVALARDVGARRRQVAQRRGYLRTISTPETDTAADQRGALGELMVARFIMARGKRVLMAALVNPRGPGAPSDLHVFRQGAAHGLDVKCVDALAPWETYPVTTRKAAQIGWSAIVVVAWPFIPALAPVERFMAQMDGRQAWCAGIIPRSTLRRHPVGQGRYGRVAFQVPQDAMLDLAVVADGLDAGTCVVPGDFLGACGSQLDTAKAPE